MKWSENGKEGDIFFGKYRVSGVPDFHSTFSVSGRQSVIGFQCYTIFIFIFELKETKARLVGKKDSSSPALLQNSLEIS